MLRGCTSVFTGIDPREGDREGDREREREKQGGKEREREREKEWIEIAFEVIRERER